MTLIAAVLSAAALMGQTAPVPTGLQQIAPAQAATSQTPPMASEETPTVVEDVTVQGQRLNDATRSFVDEITASAAASGRGLALWNRSVCVGVLNMRADHAHFMIDRINTVALALGVRPGEPGCKPEIIISGTSDGAAQAAILVNANRRSFRPGSSSTDRGLRALHVFETSTVPVRWWHISLPVTLDTGDVAVAALGEDPPEVTVRGVSRLQSGLRDEMRRAIIIVDFSRIGQANFAQITDYVAFVALAQTDPAADTSRFFSILNLFTGPNPPPGLTRWDAEYLLSLYGTPEGATNPRYQQRAIVNRMVRHHETPEDPDPS